MGASGLQGLLGILLMGFAFTAASGQGSSAEGTIKLPSVITDPQDVHSILEQISDKHGFVFPEDRTCLFYRFWTPESQPTPEFVVLVLHGIGFHGGPYKVIADSLNKRGISVYAVDARGHGLSCGKRDEIPGTPIENEDVHRMIGLLRQTYPNAKIFLLGESMGGIFALNYAQENRGDISGLILMAPAVSIAWKQFFRLGNLSLLAYLLCPDKQAVSLIDRRLKESTRDDHFVIQRRADPLAYKKVSINYLNGIHRSAKHWDTVAAPRIKIPTLILQGERDPIVNVKGSRRLFELLATSDKEFKAYQSVPHTLLWDPETPRVLESVGDWIVRH